MIIPPDTLKYYWFVFNTTTNWRQTVSIRINSANDLANLYVSANDFRLPNPYNALYKSELFSTQLI